MPLLTIFVLAIVSFHGSNFTANEGFNAFGAKGILAAVSTSGIIFALLGFEQADQLAGESTNPKRDIPRAVIGSILIGATIYIALQVVFLAALPASQLHGGWANAAYSTLTGPFAQVASLVGVGWLAAILLFPLWWDMVAVGIFSLIIFFWARAVALPAERIQRMISQVVPEEEPATAAPNGLRAPA